MAIETKDESAPVYLGRSARIVGPQQSPDPREDPHAKTRRGDLGVPLQNFYFNRFMRDPLNRVGQSIPNNDWKNVLTATMGRAPQGEVNPVKVPVSDPAVMTKHIKSVAQAIGADAVGVAPTIAEYVYQGGRRTEEEYRIESAAETPEEIARKFPYALCTLVAWPYEMNRAHRSPIGDASYHFGGNQRGQVVHQTLAGYIKELGYEVRQGAINTMPMMILAGLGELGRNGLIISEKFGARVQPHVILTNMPLVPDKPVDLGVSDFCQICRKCAVSCPTNSITHGDKTIINGVEKYAINWKTCYSLRPHMVQFWHNCMTCVASYPYTKPNVWWHSLTLRTLKSWPIPLRPWLVRTLIWIDDTIWGKIPRPRVKWLGYDTGREPGQQGCTVAGCSCQKGEETSEVGFYPPLKENARRFQAKG